ncbi:hypothetical protein [Streptomyces sp. NPDC055709]
MNAEAAAQAVVSQRATAVPKSSEGPIEEMRLYKLAKDSVVKARTQATNQLKAVMVNADPVLRETLAGLGTPALVTRCTQLEETDWPASAAVVYTLRTLAYRIRTLAADIRDLTARIKANVKAVAPELLDQYGVGADSAAACTESPRRRVRKIRLRPRTAVVALGKRAVPAFSAGTARSTPTRTGECQTRYASVLRARTVIRKLHPHLWSELGTLPTKRTRRMR